MRPGAGDGVRLFCFPYAGGTTYAYRNWPSLLPQAVEVCPVELPGRGARIGEPLETRIGRLAEAMATALLPYMDKPFAFFGHSMGGLIAFELARELRRTRRPQPAHLFVSACAAPDGRDRRKRVTYNLPEPEFIAELRRLGGTPKEALEHPELMQLVLPLLRADFEACQTYEFAPEPPLDCPLTVFGGLQDREVSSEGLEAWREHTTSTFVVRRLAGEHLFIHTAQHLILRAVADELLASVR
ncbi:MAG TPA: alpha/beta fold hydrolase [Pyrinomonadaceae bacterium]|nr:alpha/beta fold hydrolase [Pyrinomonadaceae bacterium]